MSHLGERLSALIDGELSHSQRERVLAHLAHCEPCRREAAALRALKQRMHALGEATAATADTALTDRLIAVAGLAGAARGRRRPLARRRSLARRGSLARRPGPGGPWRWPVRSLALAALAMTGLGIPAAAFLAGGGQQDPGPSVTPAIDMFTLQHALSTGEAPASARGVAPAPPRAAPPRAGPLQAAPPQAALPVTGPAAAPPPAMSFSSAVVAAALVRVAAASTRVAVASTRPATAPGRARRPQPAMTTAGAR